MLGISGYSFERLDRISEDSQLKKTGGGLCIYIRITIDYTLHHTHWNITPHVETMVITLVHARA